MGYNTFNYCKEYVDEIIECSTDETCEAIQLIFEECRTIMEPAGALSLAGLLKYININKTFNENYISILSGANMNFTRLRYISERSNNTEILLAVSISEKSGSLRNFCTILDSPDITEFNYRYSNNENAYIFVGINTNNKNKLLQKLNNNGYTYKDFSDNDLAKTHIRYQVGGKIERILMKLYIDLIFQKNKVLY